VRRGVNGGKKSGFTCLWNVLLFSQGTLLPGTNAIPQVNGSTIGSSNGSYPGASSHSRFLKNILQIMEARAKAPWPGGQIPDDLSYVG